MSKFLTPPVYSPKALELQWINNTVQSHDLMCGCCKPLQHLQDIIKRQNQLCLPSTDHGTEEDHKDGDAAEDEPFGPGDLEELFKEDGDDDDG